MSASQNRKTGDENKRLKFEKNLEMVGADGSQHCEYTKCHSYTL